MQAPTQKPPAFQLPKQRTNQKPPNESHVKCSTHEPQPGTFVLIWVLQPKRAEVLLRKEVIQPHLPVRLPCYDLVLITDPTFDGSLHKG